MIHRFHHIKLCTGANFPGNSSAVMEHLADDAELDQQLARVKHILQELAVSSGPPILVTICRSGRDGYVPRTQQQYIERGLVQIIKKVFHIQDYRIHYDRNLYAGVRGIHHHKKLQLTSKGEDYSDYFRA